MGTWGPGNLENDHAEEELHDRSQRLIRELLQRARSRTSREADEYDYTTLFVEFEIVFALAAKDLLDRSCLPPPEEVDSLKTSYLKDWDAYILGMGFSKEQLTQRRRVIQRTFSRFKRLCQNR